jgi:ferredoxin-NADP reductase
MALRFESQQNGGTVVVHGRNFAAAMNPPRPSNSALWDEVTSFERELRKGISGASLETRDPELARLLSRVGRRRVSRGNQSSRGATARDVAHVPATLPTLPTAPKLPTLPTAVEAPTKATSAGAAEPGTVLNVARIGGSVAILQVARPSGMRFRAGQHLKVSIPGSARRPYTIASAPSDPHLEFCIERVPGGRLSTQLYGLQAGVKLDIDPKPKGDFVLQQGADVHLMLATVTGISPFRSILREAAAQNSWSRFVVLHGASFADELVYREELEALAARFPQHVRYLPSVSRPSDLRNRGFAGLKGRLPALAPALVRELQATGQRIQVYACGHPEMVQAIHNDLGAQGLPVASEVFD